MAKVELDVRMKITVDDEMTVRKFGKTAEKTVIGEFKTLLAEELSELLVDAKDIHILGANTKQRGV